MPKNLQANAFHQITHGDYRAEIRAKDFPNAGDAGEFRVYAVHGDITRQDDLKAAVCNLLSDHGIGRRRIIINV